MRWLFFLICLFGCSNVRVVPEGNHATIAAVSNPVLHHLNGTWISTVEFGGAQGTYSLKMFLNCSTYSSYERDKNSKLAETDPVFSSALMIMEKKEKRGSGTACKLPEEMHVSMTGGRIGDTLVLQGYRRYPDLGDVIYKMTTLRLDIKGANSGKMTANLLGCVFIGNGFCQSNNIVFSKEK